MKKVEVKNLILLFVSNRSMNLKKFLINLLISNFASNKSTNSKIVK